MAQNVAKSSLVNEHCRGRQRDESHLRAAPFGTGTSTKDPDAAGTRANDGLFRDTEDDDHQTPCPPGNGRDTSAAAQVVPTTAAGNEHAGKQLKIDPAADLGNSRTRGGSLDHAVTPEALAAASVIGMLASDAGRRQRAATVPKELQRSPAGRLAVLEHSPATTVAGSPAPALTPLSTVVASAAVSARMSSGTGARDAPGRQFTLPALAGSKSVYAMNCEGSNLRKGVRSQGLGPDVKRLPDARHAGSSPQGRRPSQDASKFPCSGALLGADQMLHESPFVARDDFASGPRSLLCNPECNVTQHPAHDLREDANAASLHLCLVEVRRLSAQVAELKSELAAGDALPTSCVIHVNKGGKVSVRTDNLRSVVEFDQTDGIVVNNQPAGLGSGVDPGGKVAKSRPPFDPNDNASSPACYRLDLSPVHSYPKRVARNGSGPKDGGRSSHGPAFTASGRASRSVSGERSAARTDVTVHGAQPVDQRPRVVYGGSCESSFATRLEDARTSAMVASGALPASALPASARPSPAQLDGSPLMSLALAAQLPGVSGGSRGGQAGQGVQASPQLPLLHGTQGGDALPRARTAERILPGFGFHANGGDIGEPARYVFPSSSPHPAPRLPMRGDGSEPIFEKVLQPRASQERELRLPHGAEARVNSLAHPGKRQLLMHPGEHPSLAARRGGGSASEHRQISHDHLLSGSAHPGSAAVSRGLGDNSASTASLSEDCEDDAVYGERLKRRGSKRATPPLDALDGLNRDEKGNTSVEREGRPPRRRRIRDNWTPEEDKLFFETVEANRSVSDMEVVRLLAVRLAPRRTYQQVKGHLKNMRAAAKI
jgi:hypothetical protein